MRTLLGTWFLTSATSLNYRLYFVQKSWMRDWKINFETRSTPRYLPDFWLEKDNTEWYHWYHEELAAFSFFLVEVNEKKIFPSEGWFSSRQFAFWKEHVHVFWKTLKWFYGLAEVTFDKPAGNFQLKSQIPFWLTSGKTWKFYTKIGFPQHKPLDKHKAVDKPIPKSDIFAYGSIIFR